MDINFIGDIYLKNAVRIKDGLELNNLIPNIEAPFSNSGIPARNKVNLFMEPENLISAFGDKILAANLSNNHIMDYGERSFLDTVKVLKENGIPFFGAGNVQNNFNNPFIHEDIAVFGYTCRSTNAVFTDSAQYGPAEFSIEKVIEDISQYKDKYFTVVLLHWGQEYFSFPKPGDVIKARKLIDSGAGLIIGNHPHTIQSYEKYKEKYIYYSLGNAVFHDNTVDSYHDGEKFNRKFSMSYGKSRRRSIKVKLDPASKKVEHGFMIYDENEIGTYKSLLLSLKIKLILSGKLYSLYKYYKRKSFGLEFHLKKLLGKRS